MGTPATEAERAATPKVRVQRNAARKAKQLARHAQNARGPVGVVKNRISKTIAKKIEKGK